MKFIIEGMDGTGKDTVIELLKPKFPKFQYIREPGSSEVGEAIRNLVLTYDMPLLSQQLLFEAARINNPPRAGHHVISNRGYQSTYAYQVCDQTTLALYTILHSNSLDKGILLTCSYDTYLARRGASAKDAIEKTLDRKRYERLQKRYLELSWSLIVPTDDRTPQEVADIIGDHIAYQLTK